MATIRHRLSGWLRAADVPDELAADIVLVVNEACTNCVEHAYRGHAAGTMLLEVEAVDGEVHTRVTDRGSWKTPAANPGNSGRGLVLMQGAQRLDGGRQHRHRNHRRHHASELPTGAA